MIRLISSFQNFRKKKLSLSLVLVCLSLGIGTATTPLMGLASFSYSLMILGLIFRQKKKLHVYLMTSSILVDISMVLGLELSRTAVKTALSLSLNVFQQFHVIFSMLAVLLYLPILALGYLLYTNTHLRNRKKLRSWHIRMGWIAFGCRSLGYILMFSLLSNIGQTL